MCDKLGEAVWELDIPEKPEIIKVPIDKQNKDDDNAN